VRACDDLKISGIDVEFAQPCSLRNVFVNTGVYERTIFDIIWLVLITSN
jgi:hypothetical protein